MLRTWIQEAACSLLDKLGSGWKSILGIAAILAIKIADQMDWIDTDLATTLYEWAVLLFGVGVFHKVIRRDRAVRKACECLDHLWESPDDGAPSGGDSNAADG